MVPDDALDAAYARARDAWPGVEVDRAVFAAAVTSGGGACVEDLYLALGCVARDAVALAGFERVCVPVIDRAVTAIGATAAEAADLRQVVRQRLLVATDGGAPRLAQYAGRGSLVAWVRVVAMREAARMLPRERREGAGLEAVLVAAGDDPEIGYLKRLYRAEFKQAVAAAVGELTDRDRLLLQQHALDGLSIDELAGLHGVHRATTARWVEAARQALVAGTRREMLARLRLSRGELDSVMRLIASQLEASLPGLLGGGESP